MATQPDVDRALALLVEHDDGQADDVVASACARMSADDRAFVRGVVAEDPADVGARLVGLVLLERVWR